MHIAPFIPHNYIITFLPRDALVHSAVLRLQVVRPSVCLSVCDVGGSGSHRLEILETNCTKDIYILPGEHGGIWGRLELGCEKVAWWSTRAAISLKRVKIEEKLLWRTYRKSPTLFRKVPSQTPYGLPFPKIWGSQSHPKTAIAIMSGTAKATDRQ